MVTGHHKGVFWCCDFDVTGTVLQCLSADVTGSVVNLWYWVILKVFAGVVVTGTIVRFTVVTGNLVLGVIYKAVTDTDIICSGVISMMDTGAK